jgi:hypothetical protein
VPTAGLTLCPDVAVTLALHGKDATTQEVLVTFPREDSGNDGAEGGETPLLCDCLPKSDVLIGPSVRVAPGEIDMSGDEVGVNE